MQPCSGLIIRAVLACYGIWVAALVVDLASCMAQRRDCTDQRAELRGAATAIPATLLAWLNESPLRGPQ